MQNFKFKIDESKLTIQNSKSKNYNSKSKNQKFESKNQNSKCKTQNLPFTRPASLAKNQISKHKIKEKKIKI